MIKLRESSALMRNRLKVCVDHHAVDLTHRSAASLEISPNHGLSLVSERATAPFFTGILSEPSFSRFAAKADTAWVHRHPRRSNQKVGIKNLYSDFGKALFPMAAGLWKTSRERRPLFSLPNPNRVVFLHRVNFLRYGSDATGLFWPAGRTGYILPEPPKGKRKTAFSVEYTSVGKSSLRGKA